MHRHANGNANGLPQIVDAMKKIVSPTQGKLMSQIMGSELLSA